MTRHILSDYQGSQNNFNSHPLVFQNRSFDSVNVMIDSMIEKSMIEKSMFEKSML